MGAGTTALLRCVKQLLSAACKNQTKLQLYIDDNELQNMISHFVLALKVILVCGLRELPRMPWSDRGRS